MDNLAPEPAPSPETPSRQPVKKKLVKSLIVVYALTILLGLVLLIKKRPSNPDFNIGKQAEDRPTALRQPVDTDPKVHRFHRHQHPHVRGNGVWGPCRSRRRPARWRRIRPSGSTPPSCTAR